jgi:hypothetical protein
MARGFKSGGRTKGVQNVITRELKEMIFAALENVGGQDYLAAQAKENPTAFLCPASVGNGLSGRLS